MHTADTNVLQNQNIASAKCQTEREFMRYVFRQFSAYALPLLFENWSSWKLLPALQWTYTATTVISVTKSFGRPKWQCGKFKSENRWQGNQIFAKLEYFGMFSNKGFWIKTVSQTNSVHKLNASYGVKVDRDHSVCLSIWLSVFLSVCLSVFLSVCLSACLSLHWAENSTYQNTSFLDKNWENCTFVCS